MKPIALLALAFMLTFPLRLVGDEPVPQDKLAGELIGTWKMVSAKFGGQDSDLPNRLLVLKHITTTHMTWMRAEPKSGKVAAMACGKWEIQSDKYSETPEYGMGDDFSVVKSQKHEFTCKIIDNHWYHTGTLANGLTIEEVWERQQKKGGN